MRVALDVLRAAGMAAFVVTVSGAPAPAAPGLPVLEDKTVSNAQSDFDFLIGRWKVHNRRLRERLRASTQWDEFDGTVVVRPVWGGKGNVDEYEAEGPSGPIQGLTVRLFNPRSQQWSLYWANRASGTLDPPMIGSFKDGRGEFYDQEMFEGRSIYVRFVWSEATATSCRWEQAFSADGGKTWETNWIMEFTRVKAAAAAETCCPVIELRQYATNPGRRDDLIALFEEHFIEGQEKHGMRVIGQFVDRNVPDRFVWMRGFGSMDARRNALQGFYGGPIWTEHRTAANETIADSDNVLLLRPARATSGLRLDPADRPGIAAPPGTRGVVVATIYHFDAPVDLGFLDFFETSVAPVFRRAGATLLGDFVTEPSENTFPRLPVRTGENVFVWLASFPDDGAYAAYRTALMKDPAWTTSGAAGLRARLTRTEEVLELTPTKRSRLR
jgi:NIPSNAP